MAKRTLTNRLSEETSPYLLQHAHNPVDWYPWGSEALAKAKTLDKPILLSIGYSACHWCHVMEKESFENSAVAKLMNEHFVCIKVDREERPDLDEIYMAATLAMNEGRGGWPMTVCLTPDQRPFFTGTYFPAEDMQGRIGFKTLLQKLAEAWKVQRESITSQSLALTQLLKEASERIAELPVNAQQIDKAVDYFKKTFDSQNGGFGTAPKFPPTGAMNLLLRHHHRTNDNDSLHMVVATLDKMANGGLYDHIGGGFARYSVDAQWLVPHFEKMLYDNALLTQNYLEGYQVTGKELYRQVAIDTLEFVLSEMSDPKGGYYSATDADSEEGEGAYYMWAEGEVTAILGDKEGKSFCSYYGIAGKEKCIPRASSTSKPFATLRQCREKMAAARQKRQKPGVDDKILVSWNGLMIGAMAKGYSVLRDARYLQSAERAATSILANLLSHDGHLLRCYRAGHAHVPGLLEDYTYLADGLISLYEAAGNETFLQTALKLAKTMCKEFIDDKTGAFYTTSSDHEKLFFRHRQGNDGATPSPNAIAASVLARLSFHFKRADLLKEAEKAISTYGSDIAKYPHAFCYTLATLNFLLEGPLEIKIDHPQNPKPENQALEAALGAKFLPNVVIAWGLSNGKPAIHICHRSVCQAPITEPKQLETILKKLNQHSKEAPLRSTSAVFTGARIPGKATPESTAAYAAKHHANGYRELGATKLMTSKLGFGCYRIDDKTPWHEEALSQALLSGCNLIDTSTNYTDGASERCVGRVLQQLTDSGKLKRAETILVTKIGYVQGENLDIAKQKERDGHSFKEMTKVSDGCWHCIHPDFLEDQLQRSLARLQVTTIDAVLLHNPEYYLAVACKDTSFSLEEHRAEFYHRLQEAFAFLEKQVSLGTIQYYGVSSNSVATPPACVDATSLLSMLQAAENAARQVAPKQKHHFCVLQLPLNLVESFGFFMKNHDGKTTLEAAQKANIGVLTNRPLNAIVNDTMVRLANFSTKDTPINYENELLSLLKLEEEWGLEFAPHLTVAEGGALAKDFFRYSSALKALKTRTYTLDHWEQVESQLFSDSFTKLFATLDRYMEANPRHPWGSWRARYLGSVEALIGEQRRLATSHNQRNSELVISAIDQFLPETFRKESLSRKALWITSSTPGVSCVLVGMRHPGYVQDALGILSQESLKNISSVYDAAKKIKFLNN